MKCPFTYPPHHLVQTEALVAADGEVLVMVLPGCKQEELTTGAGIHAAAAWLGKIRKAVFLKDDEGEPFVEGGTHDGFLAL